MGPSDAAGVIAGYALANDVSEREFQTERGGQWDKGKSCETFNPLGPWLVTADEVPGPQALGLRTWVNGQLRQDSTTADLIFAIPELVAFISSVMTLLPGDIISTGTPAGIGPLVAGDTVSVEVEGVGVLENPVV